MLALPSPKFAKTLLAVDQDQRASRSLREAIEQLGYSVECAAGISEAINLLTIRAYDGLLLDMAAEPQDAGLLAWLAKNGRKEPAVMMSDAPDEEMWIEAIDRGAADLIAKTARPIQVQRTLQMAIERRRTAPYLLRGTSAARMA